MDSSRYAGIIVPTMKRPAWVRLVWMMTRPTPTRLLIPLFLTVVGGAAAPTEAEDWHQWRGIDRLGVWHETGIVERFPSEGLKVNWRVPIGSGYAGPAVADGRVFVLDWVEDPQTRTLESVSET